jgi:hypothetical protein
MSGATVGIRSRIWLALGYWMLPLLLLQVPDLPGQVTATPEQAAFRTLSGEVLNEKTERVPDVVVTAKWGAESRVTKTDDGGNFSLAVPNVPVKLIVSGRYIAPNEQQISAEVRTEPIQLQIHYEIPEDQETLVITASAPDPAIDRRNDSVYRNTLFLRDDQLFETLDGGINAGQHEGGGKSIEVRRFGFNLDHGGANGGLKVLIDDVPQNQATQGHGQGYLGSLKSISPELVDDIDIINGPFSAEYGDFSALGVVHIRLKEHLDNAFTLRAQGGSFGGYRTFAAWSPQGQAVDSFAAWEHAYTDGPFLNPLHYVRDNFTGNYTRKLGNGQSIGFKINGGRNDFDSSGQIPLDLVYSGRLDRFGYMDPSDGGLVRSGTGGIYYKRGFGSTDTLRVDGFVTRSLFDLYSNFTFFLNDPVNGDGIQQHDSRLIAGSSAQYVHSWHLGSFPALFTAGGNFNGNWINVGLFHAKDRHIIAPVPGNPQTESNVGILNPAIYAQQGFDIGRLHADAGLRVDVFRFNLFDRIAPNQTISQADRFEPKLNLTYTPSYRFPATLHFNFGRAATSEDARGIALNPDAPRVAATNFYMIGTSHQVKRFALSTDAFLIDRQHEAVYDPDNGTMQYQGPSRSYGWEIKASAQMSEHLSWNAGLTQVGNAFFLGTSPREYVDSAPHSVANSSITMSGWHGLYTSLRYRHISRYLVVNPDDTSVPPALPYTSSVQTYASGLDVLDLAATKKLRYGLEWNLSIDNMNNKRYYETQNFFNSRISPGAPVEARIHGTPGYPVGFTTGLTWRFE